MGNQKAYGTRNTSGWCSIDFLEWRKCSSLREIEASKHRQLDGPIERKTRDSLPLHSHVEIET